MGDWPDIIDDTPEEEGELPSVPAPPRFPYPLPVVASPGAMLYPGEAVHIVFPDVGVYQRRLVGQSYEGESSGLTLYDHGLGVTFGRSEGRIVNHYRDVRLAGGHLILTNHRLLLWAAVGGFHLLWSQVLNVAVGDNTVAVTVAGAAPGDPPLCFSAWDARAMAEWMYACQARAR